MIESIKEYFKNGGGKRFFFFLIVALGMVILDFASKWLVQNLTVAYEAIPVIPNFFYITKSYNVAIAFSIGEQLGVWGRVLNIAISVILSAAIFIYWYGHDKKMNVFERVLALLLLTGAVGNMIDRCFYWEALVGFNGVIDFFQFYLGGGPSSPANFVNPFATFNVADMYLTVGMIGLLVYLIVDAVKNRDRSLEKDPRLAKKEEEQGDENGSAE